MKTAKILVIGAGISGATIAEQLSHFAGNEIVITDKRDHLGGNCYDFKDENGVLCPLYGPHFFHTNNDEVFRYVSRFTEWLPYEHRVLSNTDSKLVPVPVNIKTVNLLFGLDLQNESDMRAWLSKEIEQIAEPKNSEEAALSKVGKRLYELLFKGYTIKQWNVDPKHLSPEIMNRIPVRLNNDDRYFSDKYQVMPKDGYTKIFERMLHKPNIKISLNQNLNSKQLSHNSWDKIIFTGPIDQFFNYKYGRLQYRSLRFTFHRYHREYYQTRAQINYPNTELFTRITEPKHATKQILPDTTIIKEFPTWEGEPYYPVLSHENNRLYEKYELEAERLKKQEVYFVGRLANYKYLNMDLAFKRALDFSQNLL